MSALSYAAVAALAASLGASGAWVARGHTPAPHDAVTTHGEWVKIVRGTDSIRAYVAYPERKTKAPAVIVIHEIFGLTQWEPTVADRLAKQGYVAIVPDLLSSKFGVSPADPDSGRKLVAELEPGRITADLDATYGYVNALPAVLKDRIGTIGFCWGGGQSFRYATNNPDLRAFVVCYGPAPKPEDMVRIRARGLGVYAENDARIDAGLPDAAAAMKAAGKDYPYTIYPGVGHGFLRAREKPEVADSAWRTVIRFFRENLEAR